MHPPIELILYDQDDNPIKTMRRSIVPWGVMKKAMSLIKQLDQLQSPEEKNQEPSNFEKVKAWLGLVENQKDLAALRMLEEFVVEFFGNQCTVDELKNADTLELMSVLQSILQRAAATPMKHVNPTKTRKRTR